MVKNRTASMASCSPKDNQYTALQDVYCVIMPERSRATRIPNTRPDMTTEVIVARCRAGAYWIDNGNMNCGVQVRIPIMKDRPKKALKEGVKVAPSH